MSTTLRVSRELRDTLVKLAGELQARLGRPISINEVLKHLLNERETYRRMPIYANIDGSFECSRGEAPSFIDLCLKVTNSSMAVISGFLSTSMNYEKCRAHLIELFKELNFTLEPISTTDVYVERTINASEIKEILNRLYELKPDEIPGLTIENEKIRIEANDSCIQVIAKNFNQAITQKLVVGFGRLHNLTVRESIVSIVAYDFPDFWTVKEKDADGRETMRIEQKSKRTAR